jgi:hypothetical protein
MEGLNPVEVQNNNNENSVEQDIKKLFAMSSYWSLSEDGGMVSEVRKDVSLDKLDDMNTAEKDSDGNLIQKSKERVHEYLRTLLNGDEAKIINKVGVVENAVLKGSPEGSNFVWRICVPLKEQIKKFE